MRYRPSMPSSAAASVSLSRVRFIDKPSYSNQDVERQIARSTYCQVNNPVCWIPEPRNRGVHSCK